MRNWFTWYYSRDRGLGWCSPHGLDYWKATGDVEAIEVISAVEAIGVDVSTEWLMLKLKEVNYHYLILASKTFFISVTVSFNSIIFYSCHRTSNPKLKNIKTIVLLPCYACTRDAPIIRLVIRNT